MSKIIIIVAKIPKWITKEESTLIFKKIHNQQLLTDKVSTENPDGTDEGLISW